MKIINNLKEWNDFVGRNTIFDVSTFIPLSFPVIGYWSVDSWGHDWPNHREIPKSFSKDILNSKNVYQLIYLEGFKAGQNT